MQFDSRGTKKASSKYFLPFSWYLNYRSISSSLEISSAFCSVPCKQDTFYDVTTYDGRKGVMIRERRLRTDGVRDGAEKK